MFTTFAGGWPSLVLWMFHRSWHSSVVLGEACALDVNTFLLLLRIDTVHVTLCPCSCTTASQHITISPPLTLAPIIPPRRAGEATQPVPHMGTAAHHTASRSAADPPKAGTIASSSNHGVSRAMEFMGTDSWRQRPEVCGPHPRHPHHMSMPR